VRRIFSVMVFVAILSALSMSVFAPNWPLWRRNSSHLPKKIEPRLGSS